MSTKEELDKIAAIKEELKAAIKRYIRSDEYKIMVEKKLRESIKGKKKKLNL